MITATKRYGRDNTVWYEATFTHPTTNQEVMQADEFPTIEDVAAFAAEIASAATNSHIVHTDLIESIVVIDSKENTDVTEGS